MCFKWLKSTYHRAKELPSTLKHTLHLYENKKRQGLYASLLHACSQHTITVQNIVDFGFKQMRRTHLHPHFFGNNNSLRENAAYLTFFALKLPYEHHNYKNSTLLNQTLTNTQAKKILDLFETRISNRLPVEYITHEAWYSGHKFYVNEHVLVPRSIMSTRFNDFLSETHWENFRVLDLCTGSGCIGITLALLNPNIKVDLVDISIKALEVANKNIIHYSLNDRVKAIQSDLFENIKGRYDLIITNPPYVTSQEYKASPAEFKQEPKLALVAGEDGLVIINKIIQNAKHYLNPNGRLIAEVGVTAAQKLKKKYPNMIATWLKYRKPTGTIALLAKPCIVVCKTKHLP